MPENQVTAANEQMRYYPYSGMFYAHRGQFWTAGQDSWTRPPAQDQDKFISLLNVEPVLQGILQRRRGYQLFSSQSPTVPFQLLYSFRNEAQSLRRVILSSTSTVIATDENGIGVSPFPVFTPTTPAFTPRMVLSRDFGYFLDGTIADNLKWDGTASNPTKWGIDINGVAATSFGPNNVGTGANSGTGTSWSNPTNIQGACNGTVATVTLPGAGNSKYLYGSNYGFAGLVGQTIVGVQVDMTYTGGTALANASVATIGLTLNGNPIATATKTVPRQIGLANVTFGGSNDMWGLAALTASQAQASTFGILVQLTRNAGSPDTMSVDCARITIYTLPSSITITSTAAAGNITLQSGRTYFYAFQNSRTGHVSSLSQASLSTGPLTSKQVSIANIGVSLDPQVDTVLILATLDGNDQTTLFLVDTVANGVTTYTDNISDTVLATQALYQDTDSQGNLHGLANNNPPPLMNFPVKHKGRLYGAKNSILYFSKNLDDVTTANGLVTAKWEEAWPAINQLDVSELAETVQGLLSDGETLWIATERSIRRLVGDSPANFQKPEIQFNETGVLNQESWKVVFYEGQPVGTMWLTPDFRVMASDFNTYEDVGGAVQNILNSINPAAVSTIHAAFVSQGPAEYYMLYLPLIASTPDTILVYNLRTKKWVVWSPTDLPTASTFLIDVTGAPRWLFAANAGSVYEWKLGLLQDQVGVSPTTYSVTVQTSWLDFGASGLKKALNQILVTTDDPGLTVQVDGVVSASEAQFTAPDPVFPATAILPAPFRENFVPLAGAVSYQKFYRFTFQSPASTALNILASYAIEVVPILRY